MATRYMVANSTDWSSTASWSATSGGAGGASVPATGDTVYINVPCQISAGLDQTSVDLVALNVSPGMTSGSYIGTSSTPLKIGVGTAGSAGHFKWGGLGLLYYFADGATYACDIFTFMTGSGKAYLSGGSVATVYTGTSGLLTINGSTIGSLYAGGCGVLASSGILGTLYAYDGSIVVDNTPCTVCSAYGGQVTFRGLSCDLETLNVYKGARVVLQCADGVTTGPTSGNLTAFPLSVVTATGSPFPISVGTLSLYAGAQVFVAESVQITITTTIKYGFN